MRNLPEWVIAFAAITSVGARLGVAQRVVDRGRARLRPRGLRARRCWSPTPSGSSAPAAGRRPPRRRHHRRAPAGRRRAPRGRRPLGGRVQLGAALPDVAVAPRRRRHDPLHLGHHRPPEGRGVDPPGRHAGADAVRLQDRGHRGSAARPRPRRRPCCPRSSSSSSRCSTSPGASPCSCRARASGMPLVMMHKWDPERALELIEREQVTNFVGVPTQSWDLLECPRFAEFDTSSLVSVGGGGAPAPPELVKRVDVGFRRGRPVDRVRHDRDQRLRPAELGRRLRVPPDQHRARRCRSSRSRCATPTACAAARWASRARSGSRART